MEAIGRIVKTRRTKGGFGLTQLQLGVLAKVNPATVCLVEKGHNVSVLVLEKICQALGVEVSKLVLEAETLLAEDKELI